MRKYSLKRPVFAVQDYIMPYKRVLFFPAGKFFDEFIANR
jgi:hypothetical protein